MTQLQILANSRTAQVEITIFHTNIITAIGIVLNSERRCGTLREHLQTLYQNLDVASIHLWVLALTLAYHTLYLDAVFASQLVGCIT